MAKAVRLSDIAKKIGVSTVTVSKALAGQKGVSEEMREKIVALAEEMGYVKSVSAEKEAVRKSYTIGIIVAERFLRENQSFYWKLYQEISKIAIARNCFPVLEVISHEAEQGSELPRVILEKKADGLIIMGQFKQEYTGHLIAEVSLPLLTLDSTSGGESCDCVVSNNMMGGYRMTNYLFEMGHRKIGFVGTRLATSSIDDRYFGYLKSLMEHGVAWKEEWIIEDRDREFGKVYGEPFFTLPKEMPTAFFCNCDYSASILIQKLEHAGFRVPEDVSVVGFDNYVADQFAGIGITTYEIDTKEMARRTIYILVHKMDNQNYTSGMFMLPGRFIERSSVKRIALPVPFV